MNLAHNSALCINNAGVSKAGLHLWAIQMWRSPHGTGGIFEISEMQGVEIWQMRVHGWIQHKTLVSIQKDKNLSNVYHCSVQMGRFPTGSRQNFEHFCFLEREG